MLPFSPLFARVLPPEAHSLPTSPYMLVVSDSASVAPAASSVLVPPVLLATSADAPGPMKRAMSVPLPLR